MSRCPCRCPWCHRDIRKHGEVVDGVKRCPCGATKVGKEWRPRIRIVGHEPRSWCTTTPDRVSGQY